MPLDKSKLKRRVLIRRRALRLAKAYFELYTTNTNEIKGFKRVVPDAAFLLSFADLDEIMKKMWKLNEMAKGKGEIFTLRDLCDGWELIRLNEKDEKRYEEMQNIQKKFKRLYGATLLK